MENKQKMPIKEFKLRKKIAEFVNKQNAYKNFDRQVRERILGQKNISEITYNVFMWLRGLAENCDMKNNAMIVAPSGCGKTETYRVIKEILSKEIANIPVVQLDSTRLTSEGFKGMDTREFLSTLFTDSVNGIAIIVLDEIDKRLLPSYTSRGENVNVSIQSQLLTLIEGTEVSGYSNDDEVTIDTRNTLFVAAGAFQHIRDKRNSEREDSMDQVCTIGFCPEQPIEEDMDEEEDISLEEIIENGAMPEFMGRFSTIINLHKLDYESIKIIVNRYAKEFGRKMKCRIVITESVVEELYEKYCDCELGCRILKNLLWKRISPIGIELERNNLIKKENYIKIICDTAGDTYHISQRKIRTPKENIA